ncbi:MULTISPECIES: hypothetical protein [unclassified Paraburkholderia]|uniref:hypothetical protein n=1 Tax=unclassified Paraburkholderia TaxID=2615204 RepID=UPI002AB2E3D3|nr:MULTISPECIES: hypothetical protein [unclassified Paraburkholderia]
MKKASFMLAFFISPAESHLADTATARKRRFVCAIMLSMAPLPDRSETACSGFCFSASAFSRHRRSQIESISLTLQPMRTQLFCDVKIF